MDLTLAGNWTKDDIMNMREELYDGPDLGKIWVNGDITRLSKRASERRRWG